MFNTFFISFQCCLLCCCTCTSPIMHLIYPRPYPPPPSQFCISIVFHFSWVLQPSQEKLKTSHGYAKFWEANKVHYGRCASGIYFLCYISHFPFLFFHFDTSHIICIPNPLYSLASSREPLFTHLI